MNTRTALTLVVVCFVGFVTGSCRFPFLVLDIGADTIKAGIVSAQPPYFDAILNEQSGRKSPNFMYYNPERAEFRYFAHGASTKKGAAVVSVHSLLGTESPVLGEMSAEQLVSFQIQRMYELGIHQAGALRNCSIITVKPSFSYLQRQKLQESARLAGIHLDKIIDSDISAAYLYATERAEEITDIKRILFVDSGYSSTVMTLAEFELVGDAIDTRILATNWDLEVSGKNVDAAFSSFIVEKILSKTQDADVKRTIENSAASKDRLWSRIVKEASRLKIVLSANQMGSFSIESLISDKDFSEQISRADFATATEKLLQPLETMLNQLLSVSHKTLDDIHQVEILGGNSRLPNFQTKLKQITKKDKLGTKLNADESVLSSLMYVPHKALNIETQNRNKWEVSVENGNYQFLFM